MTETAYDEVGQIAAQTIHHLNGLGLVRRTENWAGGNDWNVSETEYDALGRVWRQSNPFAKAANPADEQKYWNEVAYDVLGRVTHLRAPDGSISYQYFNEANRPGDASSSMGQTVRSVDPWGRERWTSAPDALGQLVEVVMPNPDGNGSVLEPGSIATNYRYDGLGQLIQARLQGPRPQVRDFRMIFWAG